MFDQTVDMNKFGDMSDQAMDRLVLHVLQLSVVPVDAPGLANLIMVFGHFTFDTPEKLKNTVASVNKGVADSLKRLLEAGLVETRPIYWEFDQNGLYRLGYVRVGLLDAVADVDESDPDSK